MESFAKDLSKLFTDELLEKYIIDECKDGFKDNKILKQDIDYCKKFILTYNHNNLINDWDNYCKINIKYHNKFIKSYLKHALNCNEINNNHKINIRRYIIYNNNRIDEIKKDFNRKINAILILIFLLFSIKNLIYI